MKSTDIRRIVGVTFFPPSVPAQRLARISIFIRSRVSTQILRIPSEENGSFSEER